MTAKGLKQLKTIRNKNQVRKQMLTIIYPKFIRKYPVPSTEN